MRISADAVKRAVKKRKMTAGDDVRRPKERPHPWPPASPPYEHQADQEPTPLIDLTIELPLEELRGEVVPLPVELATSGMEPALEEGLPVGEQVGEEVSMAMRSVEENIARERDREEAPPTLGPTPMTSALASSAEACG